MSDNIEFYLKLSQRTREELLELIEAQDPDMIEQIELIESVFTEKLTHLTWNDGSPVQERPLTNLELAYLIDPPFKKDHQLTAMGFTEDQQRELHIASDRVLWAKEVLRVKPRVYQTLVLRHPSLRKVLRWGRRLGKTWVMAVTLLHYSYTTKDGRCLVMAPMKSQVKLIFEEALKLAENSPEMKQAIKRSPQSPQFEIYFTNGATVRFFTTGMKSGGKSDVARGQEAHVIILDEMDYMGTEDTTALYAMLQRTDENQPQKLLMAASTPSGRREKFWEWCVKKKRYKEWWFPSYVNPNWTEEDEEEQREANTEMGYRHEIEADWGEDEEGVYPRPMVDRAFLEDDWAYVDSRTRKDSLYLMGVDWDKFGAGPNIVVLEACSPAHPDKRLQNRLRTVFRYEIPRSEFVLTEMVDMIINLNARFNPEHIYVDRGSGEVQVELLHKWGMEHPESGLRKKVKGVSFSETLEVRDPASKQMEKKHIKPFMVENLRNLLEKEKIVFPARDEELYMQLISYVVVRINESGRPVFEASGTQKDHAHDALILACFAYTQNYDELLRTRVARFGMTLPGDVMDTTYDDDGRNHDRFQKVYGSDGPAKRRRAFTARPKRSYVPIVRKKW